MVSKLSPTRVVLRWVIAGSQLSRRARDWGDIPFSRWVNCKGGAAEHATENLRAWSLLREIAGFGGTAQNAPPPGPGPGGGAVKEHSRRGGSGQQRSARRRRDEAR